MRGRLLGPLLVVVLVLPVFTGCIGTDPLEETNASDPAASPDPIPSAPEPFGYLLCEGGELKPLAGGHDGGCNVRLTDGNGPAAEVDVAVDPTDPMTLVAGSKDFTLDQAPPCSEHNVWSGVYRSTDGGRTWTHDLLPGHPGDDRRTPLSAYDCGSDPVLAFGPNGTAYYAGIYFSMDTEGEGPLLPQLGVVQGYPIENASLAVTRSTDGGASWEDPVVLIHREDGSLIDKEWMAVDQRTGQIYVSYFDSQDGNIEVMRSDDGARTWTEPVTVVPGGGEDHELAHAHQFAQVGVGPDGTVHLVYWATQESGGVTGIYHTASTDDGVTWSQPREIATYAPVLDLEFTHKYRIVSAPDLAIDPSDGSVHVAYPSPATNGVPEWAPQNLDIYAVTSTDGGSTWTDPTRVNDDLVGPQNEQWMATAEVGPDGTLHVTWLDYREDPQGQWAYVYYAHSSDEGASFSENVRVSDVPFDGTGGYHQSGAGTVGDYMGIAVTEKAVTPVWADTRHERNDVFSAVIPARGR